MFLFEIFIWVFFAFIMYAFAQRSYSQFPTNNKIDKFLWGYIMFFTFISAIRWGVGVDSISYAYGFMRGTTGHEYRGLTETEYLHSFLIHSVHDLGLHFSIGLGVLAFLQIFFIVMALKSHKNLLLVLPIVMFGSFYYLHMMNGVRQMIVAFVFLWASKFIVSRNYKWYFSVIFVASFMHHSALMLLPFYFIPTSFSLADKRTLGLLALTLCFIIGITPQFQGIIQYAENLAVLAGYDNYAERVNEYLQEDYEGASRALGPMQLSYLITAYFTIWFGPRLKKKYYAVIPCFNIWFLLSVAYCCLYFLVCNISHIFIRPVDYFVPFHMVIVCLMLWDCWSMRKHSQFAKQWAYILIVIMWTNISWQMVKSTQKANNGQTEMSTYKVFWTQRQDEYDDFFILLN